MEVDCYCLHPSIVCVPRIIHITFIDLQENKNKDIVWLFKESVEKSHTSNCGYNWST